MKYLISIFLIGCSTNSVKNDNKRLKPKGTCVRIIPKGREVIVPCN